MSADADRLFQALDRAFVAHLGTIVPPRMPSEPKPIPSDRSDETRDAMATGV